MATIDLAQTTAPDPLVINADAPLKVQVEIYKKGIANFLGQGSEISARFYIDVPRGKYFQMKYVKDQGASDLYEVQLKPFSLEPKTYAWAIAITDQKIPDSIHWSEGNFYWVTQWSYGYTNPSYPNHEWIHSFRTLIVKPLEVEILPYKK